MVVVDRLCLARVADILGVAWNTISDTVVAAATELAATYRPTRPGDCHRGRRTPLAAYSSR